jgi:hypothetical protein
MDVKRAAAERNRAAVIDTVVDIGDATRRFFKEEIVIMIEVRLF